MNKAILLIYFLTLLHSLNAQILNQNDFSIGETLEIKSSVLDENRDLNIYLPNSYHSDSTRSYPVIYLLDGSHDEDFLHVSGIVQFCSFPWIKIIEESIVVGIGNVDRKRDFTYPSTVQIDRKEFPTSGKSATFIKFLGEELPSIISQKYRVTKSKTIIGQSLGGLLAVEVLFTRPDLFDNYIIISPSLWWDNENLLDVELEKSFENRQIYIGVGKEGNVMERVARSLYDKISIEKSDETRLFFKYFDQKSHGDALHLAVYDAFERLFKHKEEDEE